MACPKCGCHIPETARFCSACGTALEQVPPHFLRFFEADAGERRYITVLFSDMSGYTALSEKIDPEEVKEITGRVFGGIARIISRYEGFVEKYIGDAVVALFGARKSFEDDPVRAVRAAMEIHRFVNGVSPEIEQAFSIPVSMHSAVNTGLVVTGRIDLEKGTHGVVGDTINVAARLSSHADKDEILVSGTTYRRIQQRFAFQPLGDIRVKGKSKPVAAFQVISEIRPQRACFSCPQLNESYLGRDAEMALLMQMTKKTISTCKGGLITITGEAGIGKSRLVVEFIRQQKLRRSEPCSLIECHPAATSEATPFSPFLHFLQTVFNITKNDDDSRALMKMQKRLSGFSNARALESLPYLARLLNLSIPRDLEKKIQFLDGRAVKQQLYYIFRKLIAELAGNAPLILIFEDLQWVDDASAGLIRHILPLAEDLPVMFIFVSRNMEQGHCKYLHSMLENAYSPIHTRIALNPLSAEDSIKLVTRLLDVEDITEQIKGLILKKGDGNPFFIVELIQVLIANQVIERAGNSSQWHIREFTGEINVPDTVRGLIFALIDRLDDEKKQLIKIASVIGRTFLYKVLAAIVETDQYIEDKLSQLQLIKLIRLHASVPELEYIFYHTLTREAAYESILIRHRRQLHKQAGQAIEAVFKDQKEKFYTHLAYHYARAKEWERAQKFLFKAGNHAESIAADTAAFGYYKKAIAAYKAAFGENLDPGQTAVFNRKIGEGFYRRGDHGQALAYLGKAMSYYEKAFPGTKWGIRTHLFCAVFQQLLHRVLPGFFIGTERQHCDEVIKERVQIYETMGWIDFFLNRERLALNIIRGLNFVERNGYNQAVVIGLTGLGLVCDSLKLPAIAKIYHKRSFDLVRQIDYPIAEGHCYFGLGWHQDFKGNREKAVHYYAQSARVFGNIGDLRRWGDATIFTAFMHMHAGDFPQALDLSEKVYHFGENSGDRQLMGWGLHGQAMVHIRSGEFEKAENKIQKAVELLQVVPDLYVMNLAKGDLGLCCLHSGQFEKAFDLLMDALQNLHRMKFKGHFVCFLKNSIAEYHVKQMALKANIKNARLVRKAGKACAGAVKESRYYVWAVPGAKRWQGRFYRLTGRPEKAQKMCQEGLVLAEKLGMIPEAALIRNEMQKSGQ